MQDENQQSKSDGENQDDSEQTECNGDSSGRDMDDINKQSEHSSDSGDGSQDDDNDSEEFENILEKRVWLLVLNILGYERL